MTSSWEMKEGHVVCHWFGPIERDKYESPWMQASSNVQGAYLSPMPDFANHSPFGGPYSFWFLPRTHRQPER
jgi:hypothetical protein